MKSILRCFSFVIISLVYMSSAPGTLAQSKCDASTLKGSFGFSAGGLVPETRGKEVQFEPFAQVALVKFDGEGKVVVTARVQYHGQISNVTYSGTYKIQSGCTGSADFFEGGGTQSLRWEFVVVSSASEIETLALFPKTDSRPLFSTNFKQERL